MAKIKIRTTKGLVNKFRLRQARQGLSRYALAEEISKALKVPSPSVDRKLARMYDGKTLDVDFAVAVAHALGLKIEVGDSWEV